MTKHWSPHLPTKTYGLLKCSATVGHVVDHYLDTRRLLAERDNVGLISSTLQIVETDGVWGWTAEGADRTKVRDHADDGPCWCGGPDGPRIPWAYDDAAGEWKREE